MPATSMAPAWLKRWPYWPVITHPQLRILLPGIGISSLGDGMSTVTISWLALKIAPAGQSALWLALAVAAYTLPGALGAVAFVRWLGGRSGAELACWDAALRAVMLLAVPLAFTAHLLSAGLYVALLAASSLLSAWGKAGRYTLLYELLPDEHLQAGNAIVNVLLEFSTVVGPSLAAVVIAAAGAQWAIGIDALTFSVLALSYRLAVPPAAKGERIKPGASRSEGFRAIRKERSLVGLLVMSFGFFLFFGPVTVALPLHVVHDLHARPGVLAGYFTCFGIGAVTGAIAAGHMKNWPALPTSIGTVLGVGLALAPIGLGAPTVVGWLAFGLVGLIWGPFPSTTTTLIQRTCRQADLPAVLAARGALISVASPLGAMSGAALAAIFGAQGTVLFSSCAITAIGLCAIGYFTARKTPAPERRELSQEAAVHDRLPEAGGWDDTCRHEDGAMIRHELAAADLCEVEQVISDLVGLGLPADEPGLLEAAVVAAHGLPRPLREQLVALRLRELTSTLLVSGFVVADNELGPTPGHWREAPSGPVTRPDAYLLLVGSLLGDAFGWSTQQDGRIIHNVLPIKGHERQQVSSNSDATLSWHTEDGFCEYRPDYVVLLCLRNPDRAITRYADVSSLPIPSEDRELLSEPFYRIRSDYSHRPAQNLADPAKQAAFDLVNSHKELIPILSGDLSDPVVRLDADFLDQPSSPRHAAALTRLCELVQSSLEDLILTPGDLLIIDNFRAVHGRAPFAARFDGTDRWLKRLYIARDLRRSRTMRRGVTGRLLFA